MKPALLLFTLLALSSCNAPLQWALRNPPHPTSDLSGIDPHQPEHF